MYRQYYTSFLGKRINTSVYVKISGGMIAEGGIVPQMRESGWAFYSLVTSGFQTLACRVEFGSVAARRFTISSTLHTRFATPAFA
jgi:hypothetical protein